MFKVYISTYILSLIIDADCSYLNIIGLQDLWDLVWDIKSRLTEYDMVVFTEERQIPKLPSHTTGLQDLLDITTETSTVQEYEISKQMILDLTKHPRYTPVGQALLSAGTDRMAILPAYAKVLVQASYLNDCYINFVPGSVMGYQSPPRHLILTGVPGIGIYLYSTHFTFFRRVKGD